MELTGKQSFRRPKVKAITTGDGDTAFIRVVSGTERDEWLEFIRRERAKPEDTPCQSIYATLCVRALCDPMGNRIFDSKDAAQFAGDTDSKLLLELFNAALDWNRLGKDAVADEKKGSGQTLTAPSGLPLPEPSVQP